VLCLPAGNYATAHAPFLISPLQGFRDVGFEVEYVEGCGIAARPLKPSGAEGIAAAVAAAKRAEVVIVVAGLDGSQEGEGHDRESLLLPGHQTDLIEAVADAASEPIVVLLMSGSALDVSSLVSNRKVGAIVWVGYPGQAGGTAIAEAVVGITAVAGRLPMTWYYANYTTQLNKTQMGMRPSAATGYPGRTHRFVSEPVLFSFGAGEHYTTFITELHVAKPTVSIAEAEAQLDKTRASPHLAPTIISPRVTVRNSGVRRSDYSVLLFLTPPGAGLAGRPIQQLRQFERVATLPDGGSIAVELPLTCHDFALAGEDGVFAIVPGAWTLRVDGSETVVQVG
jgi:beta-D-xylosidase 4